MKTKHRAGPVAAGEGVFLQYHPSHAECKTATKGRDCNRICNAFQGSHMLSITRPWQVAQPTKVTAARSLHATMNAGCSIALSQGTSVWLFCSAGSRHCRTAMHHQEAHHHTDPWCVWAQARHPVSEKASDRSAVVPRGMGHHLTDDCNTILTRGLS